MIDIKKYNAIHDSIMNQYTNGTLTCEQATELNNLAIDKYFSEGAPDDEDFHVSFNNQSFDTNRAGVLSLFDRAKKLKKRIMVVSNWQTEKEN